LGAGVGVGVPHATSDPVSIAAHSQIDFFIFPPLVEV
jgi:mannitol/fructose-specific phosphotransferase system IIA component